MGYFDHPLGGSKQAKDSVLASPRLSRRLLQARRGIPTGNVAKNLDDSRRRAMLAPQGNKHRAHESGLAKLHDGGRPGAEPFRPRRRAYNRIAPVDSLRPVLVADLWLDDEHRVLL